MDVLITSASRDKCLKSEIETFKKHVICSQEFDFHLHEDCVPGLEDSYEETVRWSKESGIFKTVLHDKPRVGRGTALNQLREYANSKYVFYMEEDFDWIRSINLDYLIQIMDNYSHINQIAFNWRNDIKVPKPNGPNGQKFFYYENRMFNYHTLHVSERWTWQPALWRTEWVKKYWNFDKFKSNKGFNRKFKQDIGFDEWNPKWHEENIGAYYYGSSFDMDKVYVEHTSWDIRHDRAFL